MKRYSSLLTVLLTASMLSFCTVAEPVETQPNFIVIIADDMNWNDCGPYGNNQIITPNINKMAEDGMTFDHAFLTCSSCSPSRASILTARYPHNTGAPELHMHIPAEQILVSEVLREAGYFTAAAGKWHLGDFSNDKFDMIKVAGKGNPSGCGEWLDVLRERPKEKPFFMWFAAKDPHRPYPRNKEKAPPVNALESILVPPHLPDTPVIREDLSQYYNEITRLDGYIGQVRQELEQQKVADNTFIVFMSDNGRPFPGSKTKVTDEGAKTPFIVIFPGRVQPGSRCSSLISAIDLSPTLLDLAQLDMPESFQGRPITPLLSNPEQPFRKYIFAEHNWHDYEAYERGVRDERFTYIRNWLPEKPLTPPADAVTSPSYKQMIKLEKEGKLEAHQREPFVTPSPSEFLYDNEADPHSLTNLISNPEYKAVADRLRKTLHQWRTDTRDIKPEPLTPDKFDRTTGKLVGKLNLGKSVDLVQ